MCKKDKLQTRLKDYHSLKNKIYTTGVKLMTGGIYPFDLFCIGSLHRSFNLLDGFKELIMSPV